MIYLIILLNLSFFKPCSLKIFMSKAIAYGRIGLLGNPSDMYGGKCISFTFGNYAEVEVKDSDKLQIHGEKSSDDNLVYNGSNELIKATIRYMGIDKIIERRNKSLEISYKSNIPKGSGLSGSSAIIISLINALNDYLILGINDKRIIAEKALHVETDEMIPSIAAGFQDRYVIAFGGVCYMDFRGKEYLREPCIDGFGKLEQLSVKNIPCFLCLSVEPKSSATIHNPLRDKFLSGSEQEKIKIKSDMDKIADLAEQGKEPLLRGDWCKIGKLMNKNTELREELRYHLGKNRMHLEKDLEMIDYAVSCGALGAKVAGSGGAIVFLTENRDVLYKVMEKYPCLIPKISHY